MQATRVAKVRGRARRIELELEGFAQRRRWRLQRRVRHEARRFVDQWWREQQTIRSDEYSLVRHERRKFSQNGEDGILEEIFRRVGTTNRFFVEIGASDGRENCTRRLSESGWSGVWIEADAQLAAASRAIAGERVQVLAVPARQEDIAAVLTEAAVPERPDLLVIDIDGNDWWVLDAILRLYRPRVLVTEYNSAFTPGEWWTQKYEPNHRWDGTFRHGASLTALSGLAASHQMKLIACDSRGINAFFLDEGLLSSILVASVGDVAHHYVGPWFTQSVWGHPRVVSNDRPMMPLKASELELVRVADLDRLSPHRVLADGEPFVFRVRVANGTHETLRSTGPSPVHLGLSWRNSAMDVFPSEPMRMPLAIEVLAGTDCCVTGWLPAPSRPGVHQLVVSIVQEGVAWLDPTRPGGEESFSVEVGPSPAQAGK